MTLHHACAIFAGRRPEPAIAGAKERALLGIAQQIGDLGRAQFCAGEMMLRELARGLVGKRGK
jgi:hypothetical protein